MHILGLQIMANACWLQYYFSFRPSGNDLYLFFADDHIRTSNLNRFLPFLAFLHSCTLGFSFFALLEIICLSLLSQHFLRGSFNSISAVNCNMSFFVISVLKSSISRFYSCRICTVSPLMTFSSNTMYPTVMCK